MPNLLCESDFRSLCVVSYRNYVHLLFFSILELTDSSSSTVNMQSLRLLVNLSTNPNMIEYLQSAEVSLLNKLRQCHFFSGMHCFHGKTKKIIYCLNFFQASSYLWKLLDINQSEDKLLRVVTCLANIVCHSGMRRQTQVSTPTSDKSSTAFLNGASLISQQYAIYRVTQVKVYFFSSAL